MERLAKGHAQGEHEHDDEYANRPAGHFFPPATLSALVALDRRERAHGL